jgi:hypothetical protein
MSAKRVLPQELVQKMIEANGHFFSVQFVKKNGEVRDMNCRLGVKKYLKGVGRMHPPNMVNVFDVKAKGYRYVNLDTVIKAQIEGELYEC